MVGWRVQKFAYEYVYRADDAESGHEHADALGDPERHCREAHYVGEGGCHRVARPLQVGTRKVIISEGYENLEMKRVITL